MTHHLLGPHEIAALLGVTRQRLHQIRRTDQTFPAPAAQLATGDVWEREAVEEWMRRTGRL